MNIKEHIPAKFISNNKISLPNNLNKIKIDVGLSFNAPNSYRWLKENPNLIVIGFEPNEENIKMLKGEKADSPSDISSQYDKNNIKEYFNKRFFVLPCALSNKRSVTNFFKIKNISKNGVFEYDSGSSSLYRPKSMEYTKTKVEVHKLSEFLKQIDWNKTDTISQIKIDAQGEDFNIIYGMENFIKKVEIISYEINAPGYYGYKNYRWKNFKMFIYLYLKGFRYLSKTSSDITFINKRYNIKTQELTVLGT